MSPNEAQLRAVLRDGEGAHLDTDTVIARAHAMTQVRRERRVRFASVAAIVTVVGGIGVGGGLALHGGNHHNTTAAKSDKAANRGTALGTAGGANAPVAAPGPLAAAQAVPCPATAPHLETPGGAATGQFGAGGSLFSGAVASTKICAYEQQGGAPILDASGTQVSTVLTGPQATELAASLDAASKARPRTPCPMYITANGKTLVIIGLAADGKAMNPIIATVAQNPCNLPVTNGTAIRYDWSPPSSLNPFLVRLQTTAGGKQGIAPSGKVTGSPIQS